MKQTLSILVLLCAGCSYFKNQPLTESEKPVWQPVLDSASLSQGDLRTKGLTAEFYRYNHYMLTWSDTSGRKPAADSMISIIRSAESFGLAPADYHLAEIDKLLQLPNAYSRAVSLDLFLTDAFFSLYYHVRQGRVQKKSLAYVDLTQISDTKVVQALNQAFFNGNSFRTELENQEPKQKDYQALKLLLGEMLRGKPTDTVALKQIQQLAMNMERWRWLADSLPQRYIFVNLPSFNMKVVDHDSVFLTSKVIVGKPDTPTPELNSVVNSFIIYPYWHVPRSIVKEILPQIQNDSLYLGKHRYEVLDRMGNVLHPDTIPWKSYKAENLPFVLRQRDGTDNTLGVIKFVFSNKYGVYLHDTNAKRLFKKEQRALSHGCIRVHESVALAHYLAKDDDVYVSPEDLDQYLTLKHKMVVNVVKPIPVLLQYFTCSTEAGKVLFHDDIYGKDKAMIAVLYGKPQEKSL